MASHVPASTFMKKSLNNTTIFVDRFEKQMWQNRANFTWSLDNFPRLKDAVIYTNKVEVLELFLKLKKKRYFVTVTIETTGSESYGSISCRVRYDDRNASSAFHAYRVSSNVLEIAFRPSAVNSKLNSALHNSGCLKLEFEICVIISRYSISGNCDTDYSRLREFSERNLLAKRFNTDFDVYAIDGTKIDCHKALLAARSIYLRQYFSNPGNDRREMLIIASPKTVCCVLYYIYCGEISADGPTEMTEIAQLAWGLDIPSLKIKCKIISNFISVEKTLLVNEEEPASGLIFLLENAMTFLADMNKFALETEKQKITRGRKLSSLV